MSKSWKQYVEHRVREIRQLSDKEQWRFCPGSQNPADIPSRGLKGEQLATNIVWWNGPEFFCQSEQSWPVHPTSTTVLEVAMKEIVKNPQPITHSLANTDAHQNPVTRLDKIIDFKSHSTLSWLLRVTAYTNILYTKRREKRAKNSLAEALTATEINRAESMWLRTVQMSSFKSELDFIKNRRDCCPTTHVSHFGLFLDDQHILQCKGRVKKAAITESSKNPVWLPSRHHFCRLRSHNPRCAQENRTLGYSPDIGYSARTILGVTRWGSPVKKFEEVRHL